MLDDTLDLELAVLRAKYAEDQPRDDYGRFSDSGGTATAPKLTDDQKNAVVRYTSEGDYVLINGALRSGQQESWMPPVLKQLDSAIASSTLSKDTTVYRGVSAEDLPDGWKVGAVVEDPGYMSTSTDRSIAESFTDQAVADHPYGWTMTMELPAGTHALPITDELNPDNAEYGTQGEMLVGRDTRFEITSIDPNTRSVGVKVQ